MKLQFSGYSLLIIFLSSSIPQSLLAQDEVSGEGGGSGFTEYQAVGSRCPNKTPKAKVITLANSTLGADSGCYIKAFDKETGNQPTCRQSASAPGNDSVGYGICTLNKNAAKRRTYGGPCAANLNINGGTDSGIVNQMKCCKWIMQHSPRYFGGATRRAFNKCMGIK